MSAVMGAWNLPFPCSRNRDRKRNLLIAAAQICAFMFALLPVRSQFGASAAPGVNTEHALSLTILAETSQLIPDGTGRFTAFAAPVINNQGNVAFEGLWQSTRQGMSGTGLYMLAPHHALAMIAQSGEGIPGGGVFAPPPGDLSGAGAFPFAPRLDEHGNVYYIGNYDTTREGVYANSAQLFRGGAAIARQGEKVLSGQSVRFDFDYDTPPVVTANGMVVFLSTLCPCHDPDHGSGIIMITPQGLSVVARRSQPVPEGDGVFGTQSIEDWIGFTPPGVSTNGMIAFAARKHLRHPHGAWATGYADGLYLFQDNKLHLIATATTPLPPPYQSQYFGGFYDLAHPVALNADGEIALLADGLDSHGISGGTGIYLFANGQARTLVHVGMSDPSTVSGGQQICQLDSPALSDNGAVAFLATLSRTQFCYGSAASTTLYTGRLGHLIAIARTGMAAPGGRGIVTDIYATEPVMTASGWVGYIVKTTAGEDLDVFNGQQTVRVLGTGDSIAGQTVSGFSFNGLNVGGAVGMNNHGQVVARVNLSNGGAAIVVARVPALSSAASRTSTPPAPASPTPPGSAPPTLVGGGCRSWNVSGVWKGQTLYGDATTMHLTLEQSGTNLIGTFVSGGASVALHGTIQGREVTLQGPGLRYQGTVSDDGTTIAYALASGANLMLNLVGNHATCTTAAV